MSDVSVSADVPATMSTDIGTGSSSARPSRLARRERILTVALELASRGGYEEVQMRDVAERAGVALGTLYRYFPSKVHLLAAALAGHLAGLHTGVLERARTESGPAARLIAVMNGLVDDLDGNRRMAEALIQAMTFASAVEGAEIDSVEDVTLALITEAAFGPDHVVDDRDRLMTGIIGKVFLCDLRFWLGGRMTLDDIRASLAATVEVLLAGQQLLGAGPAGAEPAH